MQKVQSAKRLADMEYMSNENRVKAWGQSRGVYPFLSFLGWGGGGDCDEMRCGYSEWAVPIRWHPHECPDTRFPCRPLDDTEPLPLSVVLTFWLVQVHICRGSGDYYVRDACAGYHNLVSIEQSSSMRTHRP